MALVFSASDHTAANGAARCDFLHQTQGEHEIHSLTQRPQFWGFLFFRFQRECGVIVLIFYFSPWLLLICLVLTTHLLSPSYLHSLVLTSPCCSLSPCQTELALRAPGMCCWGGQILRHSEVSLSLIHELSLPCPPEEGWTLYPFLRDTVAFGGQLVSKQSQPMSVGNVSRTQKEIVQVKDESSRVNDRNCIYF